MWLLDLSAEPDPSLYDLCPHHADDMVVPRGWARVDQRAPGEAVKEPSGADLVERAERLRAQVAAARQRVSVSAGHADRYAALRDELPRLAAALQEPEAAPPEADQGDDQPRMASGAPRPVIPSRELAPVPAEAPVEEPPSGDPPGDGQLAIPVDDVADDADTVVVSIDSLRRPDQLNP